MRGETKILLYDAKTNEKVFEHVEENMVTKAVSNYLSPKNEWLYGNSDRNLLGGMKDAFPICSKLLGGILLFDNAITENENQILPPPGVNEVGHAGSEYAGSNEFRGSYNINESGPITNGYRHVWDFSTDKANGAIRSLALTSVLGGNSGWKATRTFDASVPVISSPTSFITPSDFWLLKLIQGRALLVKSDKATGENETITFSNNAFYSVKDVSFNDFKVTDVPNIGQTGATAGRYTSELLGGLVDQPHTQTYPELRLYYMDGKFHHVYSSTGSSVSYVIVHDIYSVSGAFEERREVTVSAPFNGGVGLMFFFNGKYYAMSTSAATTLSVYLPDGTLEKTLTWDDLPKVETNSALNIFTATYLPELGKMVLMQSRSNTYTNAIIYLLDEDDNLSAHYVSRSYSIGHLAPVPTEGDISPYVLFTTLHDNTSSTQRNVYLGLWTAYLGTINNLDADIVKTSSHTMKIMYSIYND